MDLEEHSISPRQGEVLKMVVDAYIRHQMPISSLWITENRDIGLSSATVRSIFADLESKGYLFSPHRSSGRLPTERAYRYFVSHLAHSPVIHEEDQRRIQSEYLKRDFRINEMLDVTSKVLAMLTNYAAVVLGPEPERAALKHIELIDMGGDEVLVILVTRSGEVYSRTVFLETRIPQDAIRLISRQLNEAFKGMDLAEMRNRLRDPMAIDSHSEARGYLPMIARTIADNFDSVKGEEELYTSGVDNLYAQLGDRERQRLKEMGGLFDSEEFVRGMFKRTIDLDDLDVVIAGDQDDRLAGLSVVYASYKMGDQKIGSLGVVGPNRMDYVRVIGIVEYVRRLISNMITRISN